MSRGPGSRQRALLTAIDSGAHSAVWVVPPDASHNEAAAWRRAAKQLALSGRARAIYVSRKARDGRMLRSLVLTNPDSALQGDAYPLRSPGWVEPPPPRLETFSTRIQAALLGTSQATAYRLARKIRDGLPNMGQLA